MQKPYSIKISIETTWRGVLLECTGISRIDYTICTHEMNVYMVENVFSLLIYVLTSASAFLSFLICLI